MYYGRFNLAHTGDTFHQQLALFDTQLSNQTYCTIGLSWLAGKSLFRGPYIILQAAVRPMGSLE